MGPSGVNVRKHSGEVLLSNDTKGSVDGSVWGVWSDDLGENGDFHFLSTVNDIQLKLQEPFC